VQTALLRLDNAQKVVDAYHNDTFPALEQARDAIDQLLGQGEPGVDVSRAVDVRRRLLKARDLFVDALYERSQALADLAGATGDLSLALVPAASASPH
jgi:outer membrane protein TolC